MQKDISIKVENLSKSYKLYEKPIDRLKESLNPFRQAYHKDFYALNHISFEIKRGETVGIIGKNGSGKSTLLKIITGVVTPTTGSVHVNGRISALLELGAGFNPDFTGLENIYMNGIIMGYSREATVEKLEQILSFADIGEFIHQPVKMYSSGMFARLAFAVAINIDPEILIVDEVLSVGDLHFQMKCMKKMKEMMDGGTTVIFVSHDIHAIRRFCEKAIWINQGVVAGIGDTNRVADQYIDFLKLESDGDLPVQTVSKKNPTLKPFLPNGEIAEIIDFSILNNHNQSVNTVELDTYLRVEVIYDVYDESVDNPVLGVAIKSVDNDYVCGLNTLLDHVKIPWQYGRNKFILEYPYGVRAIGGTYFFDVALFEETATVPIQYMTRIKEITVTSGYIGEGRFIIPHKWSDGCE